MTLWLLGKLRLYDGASHIWKWPVALAPLGGAVWIGITRLQVISPAQCKYCSSTITACCDATCILGCVRPEERGGEG